MPLDGEGSVTQWIGGLKTGDQRAADQLWGRYFPRLVALARNRIGQAPRAEADEEDAALSAFHNLCQGAAQGRFTELCDRDDLWRLLVVITARKASDLKKRNVRLKRGGGVVINGSASSVDEAGLLEQVASGDLSPDFLAMAVEESQRRLDALGSPEFRRVAELRLEGYSNDEIAERMGCARRTVIRRLNAIREAWGGQAE